MVREGVKRHDPRNRLGKGRRLWYACCISAPGSRMLPSSQGSPPICRGALVDGHRAPPRRPATVRALVGAHLP
jgi:hypothetical protein